MLAWALGSGVMAAAAAICAKIVGEHGFNTWSFVSVYQKRAR